mmetsp:Transcript_19728/g.21942  ORF Transcript_19728/g.21942 Transcript_19728/m.21942 type:complete len:449 (-) Transcript_19728:26-1372(-)
MIDEETEIDYVITLCPRLGDDSGTDFTLTPGETYFIGRGVDCIDFGVYLNDNNHLSRKQLSVTHIEKEPTVLITQLGINPGCIIGTNGSKHSPMAQHDSVKLADGSFFALLYLDGKPLFKFEVKIKPAERTSLPRSKVQLKKHTTSSPSIQEHQPSIDFIMRPPLSKSMSKSMSKSGSLSRSVSSHVKSDGSVSSHPMAAEFKAIFNSSKESVASIEANYSMGNQAESLPPSVDFGDGATSSSSLKRKTEDSKPSQYTPQKKKVRRELFSDTPPMSPDGSDNKHNMNKKVKEIQEIFPSTPPKEAKAELLKHNKDVSKTLTAMLAQEKMKIDYENRKRESMGGDQSEPIETVPLPKNSLPKSSSSLNLSGSTPSLFENENERKTGVESSVDVVALQALLKEKTERISEQSQLLKAKDDSINKLQSKVHKLEAKVLKLEARLRDNTDLE